MSETADALAYKANVRARTKEKATTAKDALLGRVRDVASNPRQAGQQSLDATKRATDAVRRRPQVIAVAGGLAAVLGVAFFRRAQRPARAPAMSGRTTAVRRGDPSRGTDRRLAELGRRTGTDWRRR